MVATATKISVQAPTEQNYDRASELRAFDETKTGVKGLVDADVAQIPRIFIHPPDHFDNPQNPTSTQFIFPTIDLTDKDPIRRKEVVGKVLDASEKWGFFQVINHGIPESVLEEMKRGVRRFYEQDTEVKKLWYTRDSSRAFVYNSNFDLFRAPSANWRDFEGGGGGGILRGRGGGGAAAAAEGRRRGKGKGEGGGGGNPLSLVC